MKSSYDIPFYKECLLSERLRVSILVAHFVIGVAFAASMSFILMNNGLDLLGHLMQEKIIPFMLIMIVFEGVCLLYIQYQIRKNHQSIPVFFQYSNSFIEISTPAVMMLLVSRELQTPLLVVNSPLVYMYFLLILLSTLRLDARLSLLTGLLAAIEFFALSTYLLHQPGDGGIIKLEGSGFESAFTIAKSFGIFLMGLAAAFVARQIKNSIHRFLKTAQEGNKIIDLFGQQLSKEVVMKILEEDGAVKSRFSRVCVMFIDIRNFTSYVTDKSPAEIVNYQNAFFSIVIDVITKHKGIINQFLGDGCMVTFGAPIALDNPSKHAIEAVLELQQQLQTAIASGKLPRTEIGVGIHVGDAVTGNIGTDIRQQYSVTGSVVILAARLEQLNKEYKSRILVSEEVMMQVKDLIKIAEHLGEVTLKGWDQPMNVYKLA